MKRVSWCCLMVLGLLGSGLCSEPGADWPRFRGPGLDGIATNGGLFDEGYGLRVVWKKEIGSGYSSISVVDGIAVVMFSDGTRDVAVGLDVDDGRELWRYDIAETYKGHDGSHDGTIATPVIDGGRVYGLAPFGHLVALELKTGKRVWARHLVDDLEGKAPSYGYSASPLVVDDLLIVASNSPKGCLTALDKKTGEVRWQAGEDEVGYQSPVIADFAGSRQLIMPAKENVLGIDPRDGKVLWSYAHEGDNESMNPVVIGTDKLFLTHNFSTAKMVAVSRGDGVYNFETLWESGEFKNSYHTPIYRNGYLYGYSGRFLTCLNAEDGSRVWKSRPPGDGFAIMVEDCLAVVTKKGSLHLIEASPEGYVERASDQVFEGQGWSPPSFAGGKIFVRNLSSIAALDIGGKAIRLADEKQPEGVMPQTRFGAWVKRVTEAEDKRSMIDARLAEEKSFPIIEDGKYVHVVYRGEVKDVAISGDMFPRGTEHPLNRIEGTDFRYFSFSLDRDAHIAYQMTVDFSSAGADPLNPRTSQGFQGESYSLISMPDFEDAGHFSDDVSRGRVEEITLESEVTETERKVWVYLPPGAEAENARLPTIYISYGKNALESGLVANTIDALVGETIAPVIAVFVGLHPEKRFGELRGEDGEKYLTYMAEELVPMIDARFPTKPEAGARVSMGYSSAGYSALAAAVRYPGVFGKVVTQSMNISPPRDETILGMLAEATEKPRLVVMEWSRYDARDGGTLDFRAANEAFAAKLGETDIRVEGGEQPMGYGWGNWRTRTDDLLEMLFPIE